MAKPLQALVCVVWFVVLGVGFYVCFLGPWADEPETHPAVWWACLAFFIVAPLVGLRYAAAKFFNPRA